MLLAAKNGHLELVHWLLSEGGSSIDEHDVHNRSLWELVSKWKKEENKEEVDDNDDNKDAFDEEAATACLRTCLTLGAPPDGFDAATRFSPAQLELVRKAAVLRARLPGWMEWRRSLVREGLSRCLPLALGAVVQGYCEPREEDVWDDVGGVPLGDVWGQVVYLREENERLREGSAREVVESLREEVERLKEAAADRKRARDGMQQAGRGNTKRGRGSGGGVP